MTRAARSADGRDVVIRVLSVGPDGGEHVELLKIISRGPLPLVHSCHTLPILDLIELEDVTFGVFPKAAGSVSDAYDSWAKPTVGDILDIIVQCLEVLETLFRVMYNLTNLQLRHLTTCTPCASLTE